MTVAKDIAAASCFTVAFYLSPVLDAAITNTNAIGNSFSRATDLSLLMAIGIWGFGMLLLQFFKKGFRRWVRLVFLLLAIICVTNATIFLWDFGVFDGSRIDFFEHFSKVLFEALFFILALTGLIIFRNVIDTEYIKISIGLILITCIPFVGQTKAIGKAYEFKISEDKANFDLGDLEILNFSKTKNVIVFVIDALETNIFLQSLKNNESLRKAFGGFTCFVNNSGNAPNTTFAVPAMISGIPYTGEVPKEKYLEKAFAGQTSLPFIFRKNGYDVRLFTQHIIPYQPGLDTWDNVKHDAADRGRAISGWLALSRLAMYKVAPMPIKLSLRHEKRFAIIEASLVRGMNSDKLPLAERFDDAGFLNKVSKDVTTSKNKPVFRWFHLQGIHEPLTLVEDKERASLENSGEHPAQLQADRLITLFTETLRSLYRLGIYDDATIVVIGDHGLGDKRAPALLIKKGGATHDMLISEAPVSNSDLAATLLADAGIKTFSEGRNVFDIDPEEIIIRDFYEFFTIDKITGYPKKVTRQTLKVRENKPANWITASTYYPALKGRKENTNYIGFTNKDTVNNKIVRGNYTRGESGITWSDWLEVDILIYSGKDTIAELVYYRTKSTPKKVIIFIDGKLYAEEFTKPYSSFLIYLPAKSKINEKNNKATARFTFPSNEKEKGTLLFVDLLSTRLNKTHDPRLEPERTGVNCQLNAVWGAGGAFWENRERFYVIAGRTALHTKFNAEKKFFSFPAPDSDDSRTIEFFLANPVTASRGPLMKVVSKCP